MTILGGVLVAVYTGMADSSTTYSVGVRTSHIQEQARQVVDQLADELRQADDASVSITSVNGATQVSFVKNVGFSGGNPVWSSTITWGYSASYVDANENGVQDEGRIVRTENGQSATLCHHVKPAGLSITLTGRNAVIRVTLIHVDLHRQQIETFVETSVTIRN
jgi:hypothetical protein